MLKKLTVTEGDNGGMSGGNDKKDERHDGDASHCEGTLGREKRDKVFGVESN